MQGEQQEHHPQAVEIIIISPGLGKDFLFSFSFSTLTCPTKLMGQPNTSQELTGPEFSDVQRQKMKTKAEVSSLQKCALSSHFSQGHGLHNSNIWPTKLPQKSAGMKNVSHTEVYNLLT